MYLGVRRSVSIHHHRTKNLAILASSPSLKACIIVFPFLPTGIVKQGNSQALIRGAQCSVCGEANEENAAFEEFVHGESRPFR